MRTIILEFDGDTIEIDLFPRAMRQFHHRGVRFQVIAGLMVAESNLSLAQPRFRVIQSTDPYTYFEVALGNGRWFQFDARFK